MNLNSLKHWLSSSRAFTSKKPVSFKSYQRTRIHLEVENLEKRLVPAGSISGHVFSDVTGNGLSADDTPLGNVRVELFRDVNGNGVLDRHDGGPVAVTHSAAGTGAYSFNNLADGTYFVREVLPRRNVETAPAVGNYYVEHIANGNSITGQDFDNFHTPSQHAVSNVHFIINGTTTVNDLRGNVHQGDMVQAVFTVRAGHTAQVSLVSYSATGPTFDAATASQDTVFDSDSATFGPGTYALTVHVPNWFFQVNLVLGPVIDQFGPQGSNIFYTPQGRLLSADNGGTQPQPVANSSISGHAYSDTDGNKVFDPGEPGFQGVVETLTGTDSQGNAVNMTTTTDANGFYSFTGLLPGTYTVTETRPGGVLTHNPPNIGSAGGTLALNAVTSIVLGPGVNATGYDFGEPVGSQPPPS
jgi:uncharacterized protein (DUF2141 family)